jgi:hypothetical protein
VRLDDANSSLAAIRRSVAMVTVSRPRESRLLDPRGTTARSSPDPVVCVTDATWAPILDLFGAVHKC